MAEPWKSDPVAWEVTNPKLRYWTLCKEKHIADGIEAEHRKAGYPQTIVRPLFHSLDATPTPAEPAKTEACMYADQCLIEGTCTNGCEVRSTPPTPEAEPAKECDKPPIGWRCTRGFGHEGPCAAEHVGGTTKEWCAAHPGSAAFIINRLAQRIDESEAEPSQQDTEELDLYDEIECDLPYLFGRASLEGHESGQRLAKATQEKMRKARHHQKDCPACGSADVKIINEYRCNSCKGEYFQLFGKATSQDIAPAEKQAAPSGEDTERLDWLCNVGKDRFVQEDDGMWRAYQDEAHPAAMNQHWQAMTTKFYQTAREAIDAARATPVGTCKGVHVMPASVRASATGAEPAAWQERQQTDYFDGWTSWYDTNSTKVVGKTEAFEVKSSGVRYQFRPLFTYRHLREYGAIARQQGRNEMREWAMEKAAKMVEQMTMRQRLMRAAGDAKPVQPCEIAAAIRSIGTPKEQAR